MQNVTDFVSNEDEQVVRCAKMLSFGGGRRTLWSAIYKGKKSLKTVDELSRLPGLNYKRVLTEGKYLHDHFYAIQVKENGRVLGFKKYPHLDKSKSRIFRLADNKKKREQVPTRRNPSARVTVDVLMKKRLKISVALITVDDVREFSKVRKISAHKLPDLNPRRLPEKQFKYGVARILGNKGHFQDWGGEKNDLFSTHVTVSGKRLAAAFAFKGPGKSGQLTPAKLGKNGDQIQRLFESPSSIFFVQYEGQVAESVYDQMKKIAAGISAIEERQILIGVIEEEDSHRLRLAYLEEFEDTEDERKINGIRRQEY